MFRSFALLIVFLGAATVNAQTFPIVQQFVPPPYPPAAVAVRAYGEVQVRILVDSSGRVISAESITGHPLLRAAARASAYKWSFSSVPGNHFLTLRFLFDLPTRKSKTSAILKGTYTLRLTEEMPRIKQVKSYERAGRK